MTAKSKGRATGKPPGLLRAIGLIVGATLVANFFAALSFNYVFPLLHSEEELIAISNSLENPLGALQPLMTFLIPSILATIYIFPVYKACYIGEYGNSPVNVKKRLLNMPLILGLIGMIGWLIVIVNFYVGATIIQAPIDRTIVARFSLDNFLMGSVVFVFSYYLLEFINRIFFIPYFFPNGKLSEFSDTLSLSIRARFYIFFFAVTIVPLLLMNSIVHAIGTGTFIGDRLNNVTTLVTVILLIGTVLTFLISRAYQVPLVEMEHATQRIQASDFEIFIDVVSNDEVGILGEALNEMAVELKEKEFMKDTFGKVVDPRVRDYLLSGNIDLGGEVRDVAILFVDIRNFTPTSAKMRPGQVVNWLNRYFEKMSQCILDEGGLVNKYIGDAILAVFGVPILIDNPVEAAVRAAQRMRLVREELNNDLVKVGLPAIKNGIGIHAGPVLAGNIGSSSRMEYTVIGDTVNVAARLEKFCKEIGQDLIMSESAVSFLSKKYQTHDLGPVTLRGKEQPIRIYSLA